MPDLFEFKANDPIVTRYLTQTERSQVTRWQTTTGWKFEFHGGHTTGQPVYVRPDGNRDNSNLPKMDTLNKSANDYLIIDRFANGNKLKTGLGNPQKTDLLAVVAASFNWLALISDRYHNGVVPQQQVQVQQQQTKICTACQGVMPFYGKGIKSQCPTCYAYF
ncbi:MAG: hypothetical protein H6701_16540 [Myxococcales bacterium]|nr:hypothetical protein [Myxococcales bacterium]